MELKEALDAVRNHFQEKHGVKVDIDLWIHSMERVAEEKAKVIAGEFGNIKELCGDIYKSEHKGVSLYVRYVEQTINEK